MPELPDLQVFSHNLNKVLKGKKVKSVEVPVTRKLNVPAAALERKLTGQSVKKIYRDGKELFFAFSKGDVLSLHLMLHGSLRWMDDEELPRHTIVAFRFTGDKGLAVTDWQKAATPTLNPDPKPAPDALDAQVTVAFLKEALQRKTSVKNVLLDQKVLRGIGNAYADEILWDARISPFSVSNKLPDAAIKALHKSIGKVLAFAEKQIMKEDPTRITGELRDFMPIHNAKKKKSPKGAAIQFKTIGGRKTYFTSEQKLYE